MMKMRTGLLVLALGVALAGCGKSVPHADRDSGGVAKAARFHCPMHPDYVSDKPGDCPICGMKLVPIGSADDVVGTNSIPGRVSIMLSPEKRQLIGLTTSEVQLRPLVHTLRAPGVVTHDETRYSRIAPRFGGWVRTLQVNYTGQPVNKGDSLFTVYSPELFAAENDYLLAYRNAGLLTNVPSGQKESAQIVAEAARRRLELLEVGEGEIHRLEQGGQPSDELPVLAPLTGHVITRNAVAGQAFNAGETLYEIADLMHLWVRASVYESELPQISVGQKARVVFPGLNKTFDSSVAFIYPHLDAQTRRAEVRLALDNPQHELRPEMWANVEIEVNLGEVLSIPASAVIDTGTRLIAFVDRDQGHLEPREVKVGIRTEDYFQVLDGLTAGERVVTRALFLVDSESQLKAAISGMKTAEHSH